MSKEKTLNANQRFILLRCFFAFVMVCSFLFVGIGPVIVNADFVSGPIDYTEMDYTVTEGPLYNRVTVPISSDHIRYELRNESTGDTVYHAGTTSYSFYATPNQRNTITIHPVSERGLTLTNIPEGSKILIDFKITCHEDSGATTPVTVPTFYQRYYYTTSGNQWILPINDTTIPYGFGEQGVTLSYTLDDIPENAANFVPAMKISPFTNRGTAQALFTLYVENIYLVMDISTGYWEQWLANQMGEKLDDINDSMGDLNDKVDTLPEDIGNEMEGVIENEKAEAESSGNKFVNQILDKLPDPSTEVLGSLKGLTDSMAYTGTDCKLQIPALVIPAIDGLFPETEIWGGTEFSFSDYLSFLPPSLLTVVQSLFTIAIVLFCVYELKGIISYCLTLNDKKGG